MSDTQREFTALQQLIAVHDHFRQYLRALRSAVEPDNAGTELPVPVDDLRAHCLYFCRGLTMHHTIEDRQWFPALRREHPDLGTVIDRLEADHHKVAEYLDQIERAANALTSTNDDDSTLVDLRTELSRLATDLLAHLSYEEQSLAEALSVPFEPR